MRETTYHFWITNLTSKNVNIADLGIIAPANKSINLLTRNYYFDTQALIDSATKGSLFKLREKIAIRRVPPEFSGPRAIETDPSIVIPCRGRSTIKVEEIRYEELELSDEAFAAEASEMTDEKYGYKK